MQKLTQQARDKRLTQWLEKVTPQNDDRGPTNDVHYPTISRERGDSCFSFAAISLLPEVAPKWV